MFGYRHAPGRWWAAVLVVAAVACSDSSTTPARPSTTAVTATTAEDDAAAGAPATVGDDAPASSTTRSPATTVAPVPEPAFTGSVSTVTAADLPSSWKPGCPVAPDDLRLLRLSYWSFDDRPQVGSLVVAASVADAVLDVFRTLYDRRFPIRRMEPVDVYGDDDDASMAADNTSAFNCRPAVSDGPVHWSNHAYGLAVDVNPIENPYILGGKVLPPAGAEFADRSIERPGMAVEGGVLTSAFAAVGWSWGGAWAGSPDYQHFSANGG